MTERFSGWCVCCGLLAMYYPLLRRKKNGKGLREAQIFYFLFTEKIMIINDNKP